MTNWWFWIGNWWILLCGPCRCSRTEPSILHSKVRNLLHISCNIAITPPAPILNWWLIERGGREWVIVFSKGFINSFMQSRPAKPGAALQTLPLFRESLSLSSFPQLLSWCRQAQRVNNYARLSSSTTEVWVEHLCKSKPTVSPEKPMGQLWAAYSSLVEAQSLINNEKCLRDCLENLHLEVTWVITPWDRPRIFPPDNSFWLSTVCTTSHQDYYVTHLKEAIKKRLSFEHCPKVASTSLHFGHPWGNFWISPFWTTVR